MKYKLIYCASINDERHAGMLKVGDTEFEPTKKLDQYEANSPELQKEAKARIKEWSSTAAAGAELVYCEPLIKYNAITENYESFRDTAVHNLLQSVGYPKVEFSGDDSGKEWFSVDLPLVKVAIKAAREGRDYLDTSELPPREIYPLRKEQAQAVTDTKKRFAKHDNMLWHAKMRFGKTITALNLVKDEKYKHTIIITHRPVVEDGWGSDFYHVFSQQDDAKYAFLTKIQSSDCVYEDDDTTDELIDKANEARLKRLLDADLNIVYFASIQDLRGSKCVGGKFNKNQIVFDTNWDLVIIDEAHEGTTTDLGQAVLQKLIKDNTKKLDLSGTAYNLLDKYTENGSVFTWDYVMEQEAKKKWPLEHPFEKNPYADMPEMHIYTYDISKIAKEKGLVLSDMSFTFRDFFKTWTGDLSKDNGPIPEGAKVGEFVNPAAVNHFLDLLSLSDEASKFPYSDENSCKQNVHTLWMVPGVKEAAALSDLLHKHPFFKHFGIANVAGEGDHDEETHFTNALHYVRKKIEEYSNTITLSCGRLTTGVTVKEWTSVFMLAGSDATDAKAYNQTIFRVQSAGTVNGVQKTDCYVYDFAPDRALLVLSASVGASRKRGGVTINKDEQYQAFEDFLKYCPVIAIDGAEFKPFSVESLVRQINRVHIDRAVKTGFADNCIYDMSQFKALTTKDVDKLNDIFKKIKETKGKKPLSRAGLAQSGLGKTKNTGSSPNSGNNPPKPTDENAEQKKLEKDILSRLSTISIRIPLLFFGGDFEIEEGRLGDIVTGIDDASWEVFMPTNLTKKDFRTLVRYYNQETVIGAGKAIRAKAKEADSLSPTERTIAIAEIFSHFHNPAKETVLTPWRIVNMHMAESLGGYCFYNEHFQENTDEYYHRLNEPRYVSVDDVTDKVLGNPNACVLEINSKTGLYPLYVAYSLYRAKLKALAKEESDCLLEELRGIWEESLSQIYVVCQSKMSVQITKRTLCGYKDSMGNFATEEKLADTLRNNLDSFAERVKQKSYWKKGVKGIMKFDAVVGNPPYQEELNDNQSTTNGQNPTKNIFQYFQEAADHISSSYTSLIYPGARWIHSSGKGLKNFGHNQMNDPRLVRIDFYPNADEIFNKIEVADGISIVFKDVNKIKPGFTYIYHSSIDGKKESVVYDLPGDTLIPLNPKNKTILEKADQFVANNRLDYLSNRKLPRSLFNIESDFVEKNPQLVRLYTGEAEIDYSVEVKLLTNDKAGKMGRAKWYVVNRSVIPTGSEFIDQWKVVVSSANAGGQKRDNQIEIIDNHSAFGRSRVALGAFISEQEAKNFFAYCNTKFIRFMFLMTEESLSSLGKRVPDIRDYSSSNGLIDFSKDIDEQLFVLIGLDDNEKAIIEEALQEKAKDN